MKKLLLILCLFLLCGCNDKIAQRAAIMEEAKSTDICSVEEMTHSTGWHYLVRKNDGSVWLYTCYSDDTIDTKTMVFLPMK